MASLFSKSFVSRATVDPAREIAKNIAELIENYVANNSNAVIDSSGVRNYFFKIPRYTFLNSIKHTVPPNAVKLVTTDLDKMGMDHKVFSERDETFLHLRFWL